MRFGRSGGAQTLRAWIPNTSLRELYDARYIRGAYELDPFYIEAAARRDGFHRLRDIAPDRFFRSAYYRRYYGATRIHDEVGWLAKGAGGDMLHLSVSRTPAQGRFRPPELEALSHWSPVILALLKLNDQGVPIQASES